MLSVCARIHMYSCKNYIKYLTGSLLRFVLVSTGVTLQHFFLNNVDNLERMVFLICQFLPIFIAHFIENQHNAILDIIQIRFHCLTDKLLYIKTMQLSLNTQAELESLVQVYTYLVQRCCVINELYGKHVLFIVGYIFLLIIANAYSVV